MSLGGLTSPTAFIGDGGGRDGGGGGVTTSGTFGAGGGEVGSMTFGVRTSQRMTAINTRNTRTKAKIVHGVRVSFFMTHILISLLKITSFIFGRGLLSYLLLN